MVSIEVPIHKYFSGPQNYNPDKPGCSCLEALVEVYSEAKRERKKPSDMEQAEGIASRVRMK